MIFVVGGTIIDGNGGEPIHGGIISVDGGRIIAVGGPEVAVPADAQRIDAHGKYIIPGLIDSNIHLFNEITASGLIRSEGRYEESIIQAAQIALKNGLTSVFDTWGPREALTNVRDRIFRGEITGSRIFLAGNIIGLGGPTSIDFFPIIRKILSRNQADVIDARWEQGVGADLLWMTADEVRARVRKYIENGKIDFLKYAGSGHSGDQMRFIAFSQEAQRAIVEEGHQAGLTVQAHTTSPESLRMEIEAGADLLQHGDITGPVGMPEETLAIIVQRKIPCAAPLFTQTFLDWNNENMPEPMRTAYRIKHENDRRLIEAGARLLLITDGGVFPKVSTDDADPMGPAFGSAEGLLFSVGEGHFHWLEAASELGMKPMDALMAATRNPAQAYGKDKDIGSLEAGKRADLLVLDADPLADPKNYRHVEKVMKDGEFVDLSRLPNRYLLTNRQY